MESQIYQLNVMLLRIYDPAKGLMLYCHASCTYIYRESKIEKYEERDNENTWVNISEREKAI